MKHALRAIAHSKAVLLGLGLACGFANTGLTQEDAAWWKGLFQQKQAMCDSSTSPNDVPLEPVHEFGKSTAGPEHNLDSDSANLEDLQAVDLKPNLNRTEGNYDLVLDPRIAQLDSVWQTLDHPIRGFRVQLFSGNLQAAREFRSIARKASNYPVYLSSMPPNYRITLGDFRNKWAAENEKQKWLAKFPLSLVIPMEIKLPLLQGKSQE
jgi:hypothetical protein|tara:strand:- start:2778 stop:3404 length:627 start_codon:yes stop_codon:yes gene_type:complete